jgi:DNA-binding transcriptional regulator YhcF (GntR family)
MLFEIDTHSPVPIYSQIAACVRRAVASGELTPGSKLPSSRDLALELEVNMHTIQHAYGRLRDEGLLDLRRGRGAIVAAESVARPARLTAMIRELQAEAAAEGMTEAGLTTLMDKMR